MRNLTFCPFSQYLVSPGRKYQRLCAVNTHRLRGSLFLILNVVISINFVMVSNICVKISLVISSFFTLLCSCFYWYCFPVSNKGSVLLEKCSLKPLAPKNSILLFFLSYEDGVLWRKEREVLGLYSKLIFKYILSLPLSDFLQSFNQLSITFLTIYFCSLIWDELFRKYPREKKQLMLC